MRASEVSESVEWGADEPKEIFEEALEAAEEDRYNCFTVLNTDPEISDEGLLAGVPVAVKDSITTEGIETTAGSGMLEGYEPVFDAHVVSRIKEEGGTILGKTNCDEFCMGSTTETSVHGPTRNPLDPDLVPGGSSGGSAAAVAAGHVPLALGSDTGGSVRNPAAFTGTVGLKPTYGLVSRYGLIPYADSLDTIGPMAEDVEDCGLLLSAIAGRDGRDSTSRTDFEGGEDFDGDGAHRFDPSRPDENLKIGLIEELVEGAEDSVEGAVREVVSALEDEGHTVEPVSMESLEYAVSSYYVLAVSEASSNLARYDGVRYGFSSGERGGYDEVFSDTRGAGFGEEVKRRIVLGTYALSEGYIDKYYRKAVLARQRISAEFEELFGEYDLLVSPTMPVEPFELGTCLDDPVKMYLSDVCTVPANLAGIPALSVPAREGEPIGFQVMGPEFSDKEVLDLGREVELCRP